MTGYLEEMKVLTNSESCHLIQIFDELKKNLFSSFVTPRIKPRPGAY